MWSLIEKRHGRIPPSRVAEDDLGKAIVIRMDASIVIAHSDEELAAGTFKGTFGHHPLEDCCDNTGESLALLLRKDNAGSNTVTDHIAVLTEAIAQPPARYRRDLLITTDGAGASHDLVDHITALNARLGYHVHYSIGRELDTREPGASSWTPRASLATPMRRVWRSSPPCCAKDPAVTSWRTGPKTCASSPAAKTPPGAQLSLFEAADGWRYQLLATNTPGTNAQFLEARHRPHARGGQHPLQQAHRLGPSPLQRNRDQPCLIPRRDHRR